MSIRKNIILILLILGLIQCKDSKKKDLESEPFQATTSDGKIYYSFTSAISHKDEIVKLELRKINAFQNDYLQFHGLKTIEIYFGNFDTIPKQVFNFNSLETLKIYGCGLKIIPKSIGKLKKLETLDLDNNSIKYFPPEFFELSNLSLLSLWYNKIDTLPSLIGRLTELKILRLRYNSLTFLPEEIGNLTKLEELDFYQNKIKLIPTTCRNLKKLESITIEKEKFREIPKFIFDLTGIKYLGLVGFDLQNYNTEIARLTNLEAIEFDSCQNIILSNDNPKLKGILLSKCSNITVNTNIKESEKLESISLFSGDIKLIPRDLCYLKNLKILRVNGTLIKQLPIDIINLKNVERLDFSYNDNLTISEHEAKEIKNNCKNLKTFMLIGSGMTNDQLDRLSRIFNNKLILDFKD